jgi:hypothetical protein
MSRDEIESALVATTALRIRPRLLPGSAASHAARGVRRARVWRRPELIASVDQISPQDSKASIQQPMTHSPGTLSNNTIRHGNTFSIKQRWAGTSVPTSGPDERICRWHFGCRAPPAKHRQCRARSFRCHRNSDSACA